MVEIRHPDWVTIQENGKDVLGYNQEWYPEKRQKLAGCGPTAGSMMAASSGAIAAAVPSMAKDILMYAGASNLLTSVVGVYFALFISLPITVFVYEKLSPIIGADTRKRLEGGK